MTEPIKNFYGQILGYVETKANGDKIGYDFYRRIVGYYDKQANLTKDFYRRIVGKGDMLSALIYEADRAVKR